MQANYSNIIILFMFISIYVYINLITLLIIKFIRLVTNVVDDYVLIIT
jgi:hypothetical protein